MTAFTVTGDKNFDQLTNGSTTATLDTYAVNGAALTIDTDSRYAPCHITTNGEFDANSNNTNTISATLGGDIIVSGLSVRMIPYKTGTGTAPAFTATDGVAITSITWNNGGADGVAMVTAVQGWATGDRIAIGGVDIAGNPTNAWNNVFVVTVVNTTNVTFTLASNPGAATVTNATAVRYYTAKQTQTHTSVTATWAASVATFTTTLVHGFVAGNSVVVTSMTPSGYNATYAVVTTPTTTTFTVALVSDPGGAGTGGTVTKSVVSYFLGCYATTATAGTQPTSFSVAPVAAVPATGYLKVKGVQNGPFMPGTVTISNGTTPSVVAIDSEYTGWIEVAAPGDAASGPVIGIPRLGTFTVTGDWWYPRTAPKLVATGTAWSANVITFTTTTAHDLLPGYRVTVTGVTPAGYNGIYDVVSVPTGTGVTFTVANTTDPGAWSSGGDLTAEIRTAGTISKNPCSTATSTTLTVPDTANLAVGMGVISSAGTANIPANCTISAIASTTTVTLSTAALTTTGSLTITFSQNIQMPSAMAQTYCHGLFIESATPGTYNKWNTVGSLVAAGSVPVEDTERGWMCFYAANTASLMKIGHDGTNIVGYKPPSGRRIRCGNINFTMTSSTRAPATNVVPSATLANRFKMYTQSAGVVNIDKCNMNWYMICAQAYAITLTNSFFNETLNITELATAISLADIGVSPTAAQAGSATSSPLTLGLCFAGGTIDRCKFNRYTLSTTGYYAAILTDSFGFTLTDCIFRGGVLRATANNNGTISMLRASNITFTRPLMIGGKMLLTTCTNITCTNTSYADMPATTQATTANGTYVWDITANCNTIACNGLDFNFAAVANLQPYLGIMSVTVGSTNVKMRNIGTTGTYLSLGSVQLTGLLVNSAAGAGLTNLEFKRIYVDGIRTGIQNFDNSISGVVWENVHALANPDAGYVFTAPSLNNVTKGLVAKPVVTGQTSTYGHHFEDYFLKYKITTASWAANVSTYTVSLAAHSLVVGDTVVIENMLPSGYNGTYKITAIAATTFSVAQLSDPGTFSQVGTATKSLIMVVMNEKTTVSPSSSSYTVVSLGAASGFTSVGQLAMSTATDEVVFETPYYLLGHSGFTTGTAVTVITPAGTNPNNHDLQYQIDKNDGSSYGGTWKALKLTKTGATLSSTAITLLNNITGVAVGDYVFDLTTAGNVPIGTKVTVLNPGSDGRSLTVDTAMTSSSGQVLAFCQIHNETGISASLGFKLKVRATINTVATTNALTNFIINTVNTIASQAVQYTLDLYTVTMTNVVVGSTYELYNATTSTQITTGTAAAATVAVGISASLNDTIRIRFRKSSSAPKYQPFETQGTITSTGLSVYVGQVADAIAS